LTNDNVLISIQSSTKDGVDSLCKVVLRRFSSKTSEHLHYNRDQEYRNSMTAHKNKQIGVAVVAYIPSSGEHGGALALEYVEGNTMDEDAIQRLCSSESQVSLLAAALKKIHSSPPLFQNHFDPFKARIVYEKQVQLLSGTKVAWKGYDALVHQLRPLQEHLASSPESLVDCHNDLLSANFIHSGSHITIIDWELSGQAEPSWELGNLISENRLDGDEAAIRQLVSSYWDQSTLSPSLINAKVKRAKLYSIASKVTWAAWGAVLHHLDRSDAFDYQQWSMERVAKAQMALSDQAAIDSLCSNEDSEGAMD
jgi:thiamine kinase-like enzyme